VEQASGLQRRLSSRRVFFFSADSKTCPLDSGRGSLEGRASEPPVPVAAK
jgi:hypothetical protein